MKLKLPVTPLFLIALISSAGIFPVAAQTWTQTSAPSNYWYSVASSADGTKLVAAVANGGIYTSTNSGAAWKLTSAPARYWNAVASSADGTQLAAAAYADLSNNPGRIYTSTNSGVTWTQTSAPGKSWYSIASSADGTKLVAIVDNGGIYISTNSGSTWALSSAPTNYWKSVASSADGIRMVAACNYDPNLQPGQVYISTNSGVTWTATSAPADYWESVASSADGSKLMAAYGTYYAGAFYSSSDSGATWTQAFGPSVNFPLVTLSADGLTAMAAGGGFGGGISISLDSGEIWNTTSVPNLNWSAVASSADGTKFVAVTYPNIYTLHAAAPLVLAQPASQTVVVGSTVTFSVGVFGSYPLTYQWTSNSVSLLDVTNAAFVLTNVSLSDSATYAVLVTNSFNHAASSNAMLTVVPALATTLNATITSATSATMTGVATPPVGTVAWFEWGTDTNYGNVTAPTNLPVAYSDNFVSSVLAGLSSGDLYHFRLVVSNAFGIVYGDDQTLLPGLAPFAMILPPTSITTTSAILNAVVNPGGLDTLAYFTTYAVLPPGNSAPVDVGSAISSLNFSILVTNLAPSTLYNFYVTASNALGTAFGGSINFVTAPWLFTGGPANYWTAIASSADGAKLVAAASQDTSLNPGSIYISLDGGATWTQTSAPSNTWQSVASSANGTNLVAAAFQDPSFNPGSIYVSHDAGATWIQTSAPSNYWQTVASSADGSKLFAVNSDSIYASTNAGSTWKQIGAPHNYWESLAASADGTRLIAATYSDTTGLHPGSIYISTNTGSTWMRTAAPSNQWLSVASSADGAKFAAVFSSDQSFNPGQIYFSTNAGSTWRPSGAPGNYWTSVISSADGTKLVATANISPFSIGSTIFTSTDGGTTWAASLDHIPVNTPSIALTADGNMVIAAVSSVGILILPGTPAPILDIKTSGGNAVISWLIPSMNFVLQRNSSLATTNWNGVLPPPALNLTNLKNEVTLPPSTGNGYFRLLHP